MSSATASWPRSSTGCASRRVSAQPAHAPDLRRSADFTVELVRECGLQHVRRERARLACGIVVVSDTSTWAPDVPSTCVGMRGLVAFDVEIRTATADLHSGVYGGSVPNSAHHLARLVSSLHDSTVGPRFPGSYDDVRPALHRRRRAAVRRERSGG